LWKKSYSVSSITFLVRTFCYCNSEQSEQDSAKWVSANRDWTVQMQVDFTAGPLRYGIRRVTRVCYSYNIARPLSACLRSSVTCPFIVDECRGFR